MKFSKGYLALFFIIFFEANNYAQEKNSRDKGLQNRVTLAEKIAESNYDSAYSVTREIIAECIKGNKKYELAQAYNLAGFCQYFKSNYPLALDFFQKSEKIAEQNRYKDVLLSLCNHMGTFYKKQNLLKGALREFKKGSSIAEEIKDSIHIAGFKGDIGLVYELDNRMDDAIANYKESLRIYRNLNNKEGTSYLLDYLGTAYANQNKYSEALQMMQEALAIRKTLKQKAPIAINLNNIGEIYFMQKKYGDALAYLRESEQISKEINYADLRNHTLQLLAQCNYSLNDFKTAYDYFAQSAQIKDSIYNEKNSRIINEMEGKYQNEKKQLQIESLHSQNELKETRLSKQRTTIILVVIVAILAGISVIFILLSNRKIKKAHKIISKQKEIVEQAKVKVELQKELIEEKNREILDSIHYAKRIQKAVITSENYIHRNLERLKRK